MLNTKNYLDNSSSEEEDNYQPKTGGLLDNQSSSEDEEYDVEEQQQFQEEEEEDAEEIVVPTGKSKLPSFKQALAFKSDKPPKFLMKPVKQNGGGEFEMLNAHKKAQTEQPKKQEMLVEQVIEKEVIKPKHMIEAEAEQMGAIERRIAEQTKRVNPFKKSAVVSTTFEVRESKRNRQRAKTDRNDKKRVEKQKQKDGDKLKRLRHE